MDRKNLRILFIGNSHTYYNEMPAMVSAAAERDGYGLFITMLAHPNRSLTGHIEDDGHEAEFNIRMGGYDYVVLQERTHPFEDAEVYLGCVKRLSDLIKASGGVPVIYATWAKKGDGDTEPVIAALQERAAKENGCLLAPVGEKWWQLIRQRNASLYAGDGEHANEEGSRLAAGVIWDAIKNHLEGLAAV